MKTNLSTKEDSVRLQITRLIKQNRKASFLLYGYYSSVNENLRWALTRDSIKELINALENELFDLKVCLSDKVQYMHIRESSRIPGKMFNMMSHGKPLADFILAITKVGNKATVIDCHDMILEDLSEYEEKLNNLNNLKQYLDDN